MEKDNKKSSKQVTKKENKKIEETKVEKKEDVSLKNILMLIGIIIFIIIVLVFFKNSPLWNIIVLLLMLTLLVFVHEGGHFLMAKKFGVHVYEFALGMGPKVLGFKRKNDPTEYTLRALPIGGYCAMAGEEGEDDKKLKKDKFLCNKGKIQRTLILVAGVVMNFITAIILLFFMSLIWGSTDTSSKVYYVEENSPAYKAGIKEGDKILEINGYKINSWDRLAVVNIFKNKDGKFVYKVKHKNGNVEKLNIKPVKCAIFDDKQIELSKDYTIDDVVKDYKVKKENITESYKVGIGGDQTLNKTFIGSLKYAFTKFWSLLTNICFIVVHLFTGNISIKALSGPVGMYSVVDQASAAGLVNLVFLTAYLSINLGVMNILPFPAFDGGRVLFVLIEAITRKKVNPKVEGIIHTIGFVLIILLMLYITFQDILKLF